MSSHDKHLSEAMVICADCLQAFERRRKDQVYCSAGCRKNAYQKRDRAKNPKRSDVSPTKRQDNRVFFDTAKRLSEELYTRPPSQRLGYMKELVDEARSGNRKLRNILTNRVLLEPDRNNRSLFHRRCPQAYLTIAQAADAYCKKFWGYSVVDVVTGEAPEPPTGEIDHPKSVVTIVI